MLGRILKIVKKIAPKFSRSSSTQQSEDIIENPFFEIKIQLREDGEFAVAADIRREEKGAAFVVGATLYMFNAGVLSEYFIEAMNIRVADGEMSAEFAAQIIEEWGELVVDNDKKEKKKQSAKPAISPADVFGLRKIK